MEKIVIAAGTGFLGGILCNHFRSMYEDIVVLTRSAPRIEGNIRYVQWDACTLGPWMQELEQADALLNLAGHSVNCRYTAGNKEAILRSRILSTEVLNRAVMLCEHPPRIWANASTATIYRHSEDKRMDEYSGETGHDFSMDVAHAWEKAFFSSLTPHTLKVALRIGIVLGRNGGAAVPLRRMVKLGLGGRQGNGKQYVSWIHEEDFARAVAHVLQQGMQGVVNIVSETPVRNAEFMRQFRKAFGMPLGLPSFRAVLNAGAFFVSTEPELVLKSRCVVPARLLETGFRFRYTLPEALRRL